MSEQDRYERTLWTAKEFGVKMLAQGAEITALASVLVQSDDPETVYQASKALGAIFFDHGNEFRESAEGITKHYAEVKMREQMEAKRRGAVEAQLGSSDAEQVDAKRRALSEAEPGA